MEALLVQHALKPAQYRVYPDTPLAEVVDLMVRHEVRAVPVVGEQYEVLGIITSGDALHRVLNERQGAPVDEELLARDVMTRAVLCVSEDQLLVEAANTMVMRDVEQLPVVRDGEFIGFVTRDTILRTLHEGVTPTNRDEETDS
jgi:CBS domain-containing protein